MQPRLPHVHLAPSISTTTWPISPAPPRPSHGRPASTSPPPTPVPQKTPNSDSYGSPAPSLNSASVATWTSLPSATRQPSASSSVRASGKLPSQSGRLRALVTLPASLVPSEPTPLAASAAGSTAASGGASPSGAATPAGTAPRP